MQSSPLQLRQYFFTKILVDQRDKNVSQPTHVPIEFDKLKMNVALEHGVAVGEEENPRHFMLRLGLQFDENRETSVPYDLAIELLGFFEVSPNIALEKRQPLVVANGGAILYSAAREMFATLTGRFSKGLVTLPGVNFADDAEKLEKEIKEEFALRSKAASEGAKVKK